MFYKLYTDHPFIEGFQYKKKCKKILYNQAITTYYNKKVIKLYYKTLLHDSCLNKQLLQVIKSIKTIIQKPQY